MIQYFSFNISVDWNASNIPNHFYFSFSQALGLCETLKREIISVVIAEALFGRASPPISGMYSNVFPTNGRTYKLY